MDTTIKMKSSLKGGILKSAKRAFGGESLVMNTFTAESGPGEVTFAPGPMGDMEHYHLDGSTSLMLQRGAFVASTTDVTLDSKWQGFKGFFSGEGLFLLKATGTGDIFFNTYGSIIQIDVRDNYYVDSSYIVAFEDTLDYKVTTLPGLGIGKKLKGLFLSGEGLVTRFSGAGKLWIQTRTVGPFLGWVYPFRPVESND